MPRYNIGDVVRFASVVKTPPYAGVGIVWNLRRDPCYPANFRNAPVHICVHWFEPKYDGWYEETTPTLRKVGVNNENV